MFPNDSKVEASILVNYSVGDHSVEDIFRDFIYSNVSRIKLRIVSTNEADSAPVLGVFIAFVVYAAINIEDIKIYTTLNKFATAKNVLRALVLAVLLLISPLLIFISLLALLYKLFCFIIISESDKNFAAFLDGFDVFWSLEDDDARSVINVLGVVETNSSKILSEKIKEKLRIVFSQKNCSKMFYRRHERYGWYYWRKYDDFDLDEYVKILNIKNKNSYITKEDLEEMMTELSYQPLPFNDEGLFQILITEQKIGEYSTGRRDYGIIFRIHHAVGDGVALIEFLCQALADQVENDRIFFMPEKDKTSTNFFSTVKQICTVPICFVDGILRKPDNHSLHGPSLLGKKIFKSTDPDEDLFHMVKDIKQYKKDINFSDVLATSLSSGLRNFFSKTMDHIPEDVAVILPIRLPDVPKPITKSDFEMRNNFTVTILDLPTKEKRPVKEIRRRCNLVRKSIDPMVNHYFLKVCYLLPKQILRPVFKSSQATLVFSNMPGPDAISICGGNSIKSLVFFVPNKGTTGLGISALCYGGVLRFSAMADANLVPTSEHLSLILDAMVDEIRQMHALYVK